MIQKNEIFVEYLERLIDNIKNNNENPATKEIDDLFKEYVCSKIEFDLKDEFYLYSIETAIVEHDTGDCLTGIKSDTSTNGRLTVTCFSRALRSLADPVQKKSFDKIEDTSTSSDNLTMSASTVIKTILSLDADIDSIIGIVEHLATLKYQHPSIRVLDDGKYQEYVNWLNTPGNGSTWWDFVKNKLYANLELLPDLNNNWPEFANTDPDAAKLKDRWLQLRKDYPTIDKIIGYDPVASFVTLKAIIVSKNILTRQSDVISSEEKDFLTRLKINKVPFYEYKAAKTKLWSEFRNATETSQVTYLLGEGFSFDEARKYGYLGPFGNKKILKELEVDATQR